MKVAVPVTADGQAGTVTAEIASDLDTRSWGERPVREQPVVRAPRVLKALTRKEARRLSARRWSCAGGRSWQVR